MLTALGNYGGPTQVHMPTLGSPAIAGIRGNDSPETDQRGGAAASRFQLGATPVPAAHRAVGAGNEGEQFSVFALRPLMSSVTSSTS